MVGILPPPLLNFPFLKILLLQTLPEKQECSLLVANFVQFSALWKRDHICYAIWNHILPRFHGRQTFQLALNLGCGRLIKRRVNFFKVKTFFFSWTAHHIPKDHGEDIILVSVSNMGFLIQYAALSGWMLARRRCWKATCPGPGWLPLRVSQSPSTRSIRGRPAPPIPSAPPPQKLSALKTCPKSQTPNPPFLKRIRRRRHWSIANKKNKRRRTTLHCVVLSFLH